MSGVALAVGTVAAGAGGYLASRAGGKQTHQESSRFTRPTFGTVGNRILGETQGGPQFDPQSTALLQSLVAREPGEFSPEAQGQIDAQRAFFENALSQGLAQTRSGGMRRTPVGARQILTSQLTGDLGREFSGRIADIGQQDLSTQLGAAGQLDNRALQRNQQMNQLLSLLSGQNTQSSGTNTGPEVGTGEAIGRGLMAGGSVLGAANRRGD